MPYPSELREVRFKTDSTLSTAFVDPDQSAWNAASARYLRCFELDDSGLAYETVPDLTYRRRLLQNYGPILTRKRGSFSLSTYLGVGPSAPHTAVSAMCQMVADAIGTTAQPTASTYTLGGGSHTSSVIYASGIHDEAIGSIVMINGECRKVAATAGSGQITLDVALSAAPSNGDTAYFAAMAIPSQSVAPKLWDWTWISQDASGRTYQAIGCYPTSMEIVNIDPAQAPQINWQFSVGNWRNCTSGTEAMTSDALIGEDPPSAAVGQVVLADAYGGSPATRVVVDAISIKLPSWLAFQEKPSASGGINGFAGIVEVPAKPMIELTLFHDADMPGLFNDFTAKTGKSLSIQVGNTAQGTCVIYASKCRLEGDPKRGTSNGLDTVTITLACDENTSLATTELGRAAIAYGWV